MSDSVRPQRRQLTRFRRPWYSPGKNTGVGCHFLLQCMKMKSESGVAKSWTQLNRLSSSSSNQVMSITVHRTALITEPTYQAFPSMGFSRQEYWSGMPSPSLFIPFFFIASKNYSFTYFWPHWIFAVGHSLSLAVESRGYSLAEVYGLLRLPSTGSTV